MYSAFNCTTYTYGMQTEKGECIHMYMPVHVFSCLIFPHSHTTIMLLGGNIGLVLSVGIVVETSVPHDLTVL